MRIDLVHPGYMALQDGMYDAPGVGGNESSMILASRNLAKRGNDVRVFADCRPEVTTSGANWQPLNRYDPRTARDVAIFWVNTGTVDVSSVNASVRAVKLGGRRAPEGLRDDVERGAVNLLIAVSDHLRTLFCERFDYRPSYPWLVTSDGVDGVAYERELPKVAGKCLHSAVPYRGIDHLLDLWPRIRQAVPYAELWVTSSYLLWGASAEENDCRTRDLYERMDTLQDLGVHNLVRVPKAELVRHQLTSEIYLYPTAYEEMCCIAALEAAAAGEVVVASRKAALVERVIDGDTGYLIDGDPADRRVQDAFVERTVRLLTDDGLRRGMQAAAREFAFREAYEELIPRWEEAFEALRRVSSRTAGDAHG